MRERKRSKLKSSSHDEEKSVNWAKEFLQLNEKFLQLNKEKEQLNKRLNDQNDQLIKQLNEQKEQLVDNAELRIKLKYANDEVIRLNSMLSARGVIQWFDRKHDMPLRIRNDTVRSHRWSYIFNNDQEFRRSVDKFFGYRPLEYQITQTVDKIFSNTSSDIHSFDKSKGVQISSANYTTDEQNVLRAICATIPCNISIE